MDDLAGSIQVTPLDLETLLNVGLIKPTSDGSFTLSADVSTQDQPTMFHASWDKGQNGISLHGNADGLRTVEAVLNELSLSRTSDDRGMLSQSLGVQRDGYGAKLTEDRYGGKEMRFETPGFSASRYTDGQGYRSTDVGLDFQGKKETDWQAGVNAQFDNFGNRRVDVFARKKF